MRYWVCWRRLGVCRVSIVGTGVVIEGGFEGFSLEKGDFLRCFNAFLRRRWGELSEWVCRGWGDDWGFFCWERVPEVEILA